MLCRSVEVSGVVICRIYHYESVRRWRSDALQIFGGPSGAARMDVGIRPLVRASEREKTARDCKTDRRDSWSLQHYPLIRPVPAAMRAACLLILCIQGIWAQQFETNAQYDGPTEVPYYYDYDDQSVAQQQPNPHVQTGFHILTQPDLHHFEFVPQQQQQNQQEIIPAPTFDNYQTEPTEPGPLDCREEQYPCTRLYSVHKPCKQCLNGICLYSLRRMYVINKEICVRTVCAHEELLRADLCRDKFPRCGVVASSGLCHSVGAQCTKSCGGC
ncbi:microfibrillar-associated protein 2 isoform X2 [Phyllobates terribilis]|uniref:microfibrillar-associated protein 2 isoform X2 n=1 Tax=Phyllobates terribilis TaxID=111132 RepID=UPI003CCAF3E0